MRTETCCDAKPSFCSLLTARRPVASSVCQSPDRSWLRATQALDVDGLMTLWFIVTLPKPTLPTAADAVAAERVDCRPDSPPATTVPKVSMRFIAAQARNGIEATR